MTLPASAMPAQESMHLDAEGEPHSPRVPFDAASAPDAPTYRNDSDRLNDSERSERARPSIDPSLEDTVSDVSPSPAAARAMDDDDSPPPTHFVEIKLPEAARERPAEPLKSAAHEDAASSQAEPSPVATAQATTAPVAATPAARPAPVLPPISLELPPDSNLVLVETARHVPVAASEEPEATRPRRMRPPRVEIKEEPLQLVETAHKGPTPGA